MKLGHLIFNVTGISLALFLAMAEVFNLNAEAAHQHFFHRWPGLWDFCLIFNIILVLLIGCGSLANIMNRRLTVGPTVGIVVGFALSVVFLPLAVWGIICIYSEIKRHPRVNGLPPHPSLTSPGHTPAQSRQMLVRELQFFFQRWF